MSSFCKQCSIEIFCEDFGDFVGLCKEEEFVKVLCEDCGPTVVDHKGICVCDCVKRHCKDKEN